MKQRPKYRAPPITYPKVTFTTLKRGTRNYPDIIEARIRTAPGEVWRWTKQINTHWAYPQEQAAQYTKYYYIPDWGSTRYLCEAVNHILEKMNEHPEEFEPYYALSEERKYLGQTYRRKK